MTESLLFVLFFCALCGCTPLDDYVDKPDSTYKYQELDTVIEEDGFTIYYLNMTSQKWLTGTPTHSIDRDSDRSVWWHYLAVIVPDTVLFADTALLYITGGSNHDGIPKQYDTDTLLTSLIALTTGTVTATLFQVPNEPIVFTSDPIHKSRSEDAIIAYTWYRFMQDNGKDPNWLLRLPMTKAAVRAMDTITSFAKSKNNSLNIGKFVVAGASKRGWTTWTTGAVDKRVIGMVPIVMDLLNARPVLHHHYRSLGGWTFAFSDYITLNITADLDDPALDQLNAIVNPYAYLDRLTMPKLLITTGGDEFFLPDDSYYFWDDLKGEKFIRTIPNAEHSCAGHTISLMLDIRAFYLSLLLDAPRPKLTWQLNQTKEEGTIVLEVRSMVDHILEVMMYHATTLDGKRRDFRLLVAGSDGKPTPHPVLWFGTKLSPQSPGMYVGKVKMPQVGWSAFFLQVAIKGPRDSVYEFTTQVNIIPNDFPFPECHGRGCRGNLV